MTVGGQQARKWDLNSIPRRKELCQHPERIWKMILSDKLCTSNEHKHSVLSGLLKHRLCIKYLLFWASNILAICYTAIENHCYLTNIILLQTLPWTLSLQTVRVRVNVKLQESRCAYNCACVCVLIALMDF